MSQEQGYWIMQAGARLWVPYPRTKPTPPVPSPSIRTQHVLEPEYYEKWHPPTLPEPIARTTEETPLTITPRSSKQIQQAREKIREAQEHIMISKYRLVGYELIEKKEILTGTEYFFALVEQKGIAETLASYTTKPLVDIPRILGVPRTPQEALTPPTMRKETVRPLAGIAGLIAEVESPVYTVAHLTGISAPRVPPYTMEYGPEYMAGRISGAVLVSVGVGKVIGKVWEVAPKVIKAPIEKVGEAIAKPFRPITEPIVSKLEKIALWPHEKIATQVVSYPSLEKVGLKGLEAEFTAWELGVAPKSSVFTISKMPTEPLAKAWATEHLLKTVTGGLSYSLVREQLRVTAIPKVPHIPAMFEPGVTSAVMVHTLAVGVTLLPKALPRGVAKQELTSLPKLTPKIFKKGFEIQKLKLFPKVYPRLRQRERAIPILTLVVGLKPLTEIVSIQKSRVSQITEQAQKQALAMPTPLLPRQTTITTFSGLPRFGFQLGKLSKKQQQSLFGKWFYRRHPIVKPEQVMQNLVRRRKK